MSKDKQETIPVAELEELEQVNKPSHQFRSLQELNGKRDPRINTSGAPRQVRDPTVTRRSHHQNELVSLLRKMKPHLSSAVIRTSSIVANPNSKDSDAVAAARLLISTYRELLDDLYAKDNDLKEETPVAIQNQPKFSLTMVEG
jgi:hypothetical protein